MIKQKQNKTLLVTVLFTAVNAVNTLTSHRNILLSKPPLATCSLSFAYAKHLTKSLIIKKIFIKKENKIFVSSTLCVRNVDIQVPFGAFHNLIVASLDAEST